MDVRDALTAVRSSPSILDAMRAAERLEELARHATAAEATALVEACADPDPVTAVAAVRALGGTGDPRAAAHLVALLDDERAHVAEHAVEALGGAEPQPAGVEPLVQRCASGGFGGMLAQRTLQAWAQVQPDAVLGPLLAALAHERDPGARTRLVEGVGLLPGGAGRSALARVAADAGEAVPVRAAAEAALADLTVVPGPAPGAPPSDGLTVVQLFLHGDVDAGLRHSGQGDTGGIATLLVHLGDALLRRPQVRRVITVSGGWNHGSAVAGVVADREVPETRPDELSLPGHHYVRVPLRGPSTGVATAWPSWVQARRGIRRVLRAAGRVDVVHLRMADVGSMVAAEVAADLGIPVVFTVAPDPQAVIAAREGQGTLTRSGFGASDVAEHLWFRDRLVRRLAAQAEQLVLFPRPDVERSITRLVGIDVAARRDQVRVVGEGIDVRALERVAREVRGDVPSSPTTAAALDELRGVLGQLPPDRRSLPLAVSVGRLAPVKGMATLVGCWLADPQLRRRCNLLVIGGDLDDPSPDESAELARIRAVLATDEAAGGVLLAGHRPNATATAWLAAALRGVPGGSAPGGVYVCASLKEEFGIAVLEAMAVGLVVVAPDGGGPATYVDDGVSGILTDPAHRESLAADIGRALDLAASPAAALASRRSRALVRERFGIDTMAAALGEVYLRAASRDVPDEGPVAATP